MKKYFIIIISFILISLNANSDEKQTYVLNNLQEDFTTCYSYYKISEEGVSRGRSIDEDTLKGLRRSSELSLESAYLIGQQLNMKTEAMTARVKMSFDRMKDEMGADFINFSIILDKYGIYCRDLIEKTDERIKYWENKY